MISCRYVGNDCSQIGEREFDEVGQRADFSETGFREAVLGNAAFIPEEDFVRTGLLAENLAAYGPAGLRIDPPASFVDKLNSAQQVFRDIQARMSQEGDVRVILSEMTNEPAESEPVLGLGE